MRVMLHSLVVWIGVASAGVAAAAPKVSAQAQLKAATAEYSNGNYQKALEHIDKGLAVAPKDLKLLGLKGTVLIELRDYPKALATYRVYLKAGVTGANKRDAQNIVDKLLAVETTFLEVTLANGPGDVYLDSKTLGVLCRAEPSCKHAVLPDQYKVIVDRPGYEPWTADINVESGKSTPVAVTLAEKTSLLTVRAEPADARVTVDGTPRDAPFEVVAGKHRVVVSLSGYEEVQREIEAREGKPVELAVSLNRLVPVRVEPAGAELLFDGKPVTIQGGSFAIPPGAHEIIVRAPGYQERRIEVPAERGADFKLEVQLERVREVESSEVRPRSTFTTQRKLALAVGGLALAAAGTGVVLGIQAGNIEDDGTLEARERRLTRTLQSHICYGIGGFAALVAVALWLDGGSGASSPPPPKVTVTPRLDGTAGIDLSVRF